MVLIHTAIEPLDKRLNELIPESKIAYYAKYLLEDEKATTVILSLNAKTPIPLKDFLFALRQKDRRVILLLDSEQSPILGYALALGIYDIAFGEITPEEISEMFFTPTKFSNVAPLFLGLKEKVSYEGDINKDAKVKVVTGNNLVKPVQTERTTPVLTLPQFTKKENITYKDRRDNYKAKAVAVIGTAKNAGATSFVVSLATALFKKGYEVIVSDVGGGVSKWLRNDKIKCTNETGVIPGTITIFDLGLKIPDGVLPFAEHVFVVTDGGPDADPTKIMPYLPKRTYLVGTKGMDEDIVYALADLKMVKALFSLPETSELISAEQKGVGVTPAKWEKRIEQVVEMIGG